MTDEELKTLAEFYIHSDSISATASEFEMKEATVKRMLKVAKAAFPELNWPKGKPPPKRSKGPTFEYVKMKDGKKGARRIQQGSIVQGRRH